MDRIFKIIFIAFFTLIFVGDNLVANYIKAVNIITNSINDIEDENNTLTDDDDRSLNECYFQVSNFIFLNLSEDPAFTNLNYKFQLPSAFNNIEVPPPNTI
jgi:hypothetical protein